LGAVENTPILSPRQYLEKFGPDERYNQK